MASSPEAWREIYESVYADEKPERKPFLIAGYQSEAEAIEALSLRALRGQPRDSDIPGERPADLAVALQVERLVEEPALDDPEEAFLAAIKLAENPDFLEARQRLLTGRMRYTSTTGNRTKWLPGSKISRVSTTLRFRSSLAGRDGGEPFRSSRPSVEHS